jgi:cyclase
MTGSHLLRMSLPALLMHAGCTSRAARPAPSAAAPTIEVSRLSDHLLFFFAGREAGPAPASGKTWVQESAMDLGVGTYAIHRGTEAVVYDTFTSVEQARWVREYLENMGIRRFTVVLSHWHLDHVAGNAVYADSRIVSSAATSDALKARQQAIEDGTLWGPPAIKPLVLPGATFEDTMPLQVGDIELQLIRVNIHTRDSTIVHLPGDRIVLVGDTLEDPVTYISEVADLPDHLVELRRLREMDVDKLLPNHGDPRVIVAGGYDETLIDATIDYIEKMLARVHDEGFLDSTIEDFIGDSLARGWVNAFEPYRAVHKVNLARVHAHYKARPVPPAPAPASGTPGNTPPR